MTLSFVFLAFFLTIANAQYSDELARVYVEYASAAYCRQLVVDWNLTETCSRIKDTPFNVTGAYYSLKHDAFGYVGYDSQQKIIVAAFKGTNPHKIKDWIDDLTGSLNYNHTCNLGKISFHGSTGFCDYYLSLKQGNLTNSVLNTIRAFPDYQIHIIGHSLGGAAAVLLATDLISDLTESQRALVRLTTFGEPRVGDDSLVRILSSAYSFSTQIFRVIHYQDIVPHLPFCCSVFLDRSSVDRNCSTKPTCPYHQPTEVYYDYAMDKYTICSSSVGEDFHCSDSHINTSIEDHLHYFDLEVGEGCCSPPPVLLGDFSFEKEI